MINNNHLLNNKTIENKFLSTNIKHIQNPSNANPHAKKKVFSWIFRPNKNPHTIKITNPIILEIKDNEVINKLKKYNKEIMKDTKNVNNSKTTNVKNRESKFFFIKHLNVFYV